MKHILFTAAAMALAAGLAACSKEKPAAPPATADSSAAMPNASNMPSDMSNMPVSDRSKMAKGTGTVTAIDPSAGTITLDHQPIPEANWPAMTMTFKAGPDVIQAVKPGDKVAFDVRLENGAGTVTAIRKP